MYKIEDHYYASSSKLITIFRSEWCVNDKSKTIFITINKCAGSSLRNYLGSKLFKIVNNIEIDDTKITNFIKKEYTFYAAVRDPKSRYISGLSQFIRTHLKYYFKNNLSYVENNIANNKFIFDDHTIPQYKSLHRVIEMGAAVIPIPIKNNFSSIISTIINDNDMIPQCNKTFNSPNDNHLDFCEHMFNLYCQDNKQFKNLYQKDYELCSNSYLSK